MLPLSTVSTMLWWWRAGAVGSCRFRIERPSPVPGSGSGGSSIGSRAGGFVAGQAGQGLLCHPTSRPAASNPSLRDRKRRWINRRRIESAKWLQIGYLGRLGWCEGGKRLSGRRLAGVQQCAQSGAACLPLALPRRGPGRSNGGHGYRMHRPCAREAVVPRPIREVCAHANVSSKRQSRSRQGGVAASGDGSSEHRMD